MKTAKFTRAICVLITVLVFSGLASAAQTSAVEYGCDVNPTGEPIGGGEGYSKLILSGDYTVSTKEEFLDALTRAKAGEVIYIEPQAEIDLTGYKDVDIRGGITIAGNRGYQGSPGPLIYTDEIWLYPAFMRIVGPNVRITGIRLRGPSWNEPDSVGLNVLADNVEIDNCEIYNWSYAGIASTRSQNLYIHHSYLHHSQRAGAGYPITFRSTVALIEANIFDYYRHAIAGSGHAGTGYEARYNLVKGNAINHAFDMHGGTDFCAHQSAPCTAEELLMSGEFLNIHHNTFEIMEFGAIRTRGIPTAGLEVHHNWFKNPQSYMGVQFRYFRGGNAHVYDNVYGPNRYLVKEYAKPSPYVYEEGSSVVYALANVGKIKYGFVTPASQSAKPYRGSFAIELLPVEIDEVFEITFAIDQVEIKLDNDTLLYSGKELPAAGEVVVDTMQLSDGMHQLSLKINGNLELPLEQKVYFQVDNWWEMEDSLEAPTASGWFGVIDNSRTSDTSSGWTYATDDSAAFYDDDSRRVRTDATEEYLIWDLAQLHQFMVTVYARTATTDGLTLWVSADGETWEQTPYQVQASSLNEQGWYRLQLCGSIPLTQDVRWFRLTLAGGTNPADTQIGEAYFSGLQTDE